MAKRRPGVQQEQRLVRSALCAWSSTAAMAQHACHPIMLPTCMACRPATCSKQTHDVPTTQPTGTHRLLTMSGSSLLMAELSWLIVFRPVPLRFTYTWAAARGHGTSRPRISGGSSTPWCTAQLDMGMKAAAHHTLAPGMAVWHTCKRPLARAAPACSAYLHHLDHRARALAHDAHLEGWSRAGSHLSQLLSTGSFTCRFQAPPPMQAAVNTDSGCRVQASGNSRNACPLTT